MYQVSAENLALVLDFYLCWEELIASSSAHVCSAWQLVIFSAYGMAILGYLHSWLTCSVVDLQCVWHGCTGLSAQLAHMN